MLRSLYAGVSGLKNHQTKMDVVGNNIANVNTIGFKSSRVTFQDIYSQTLSPASAPTAEFGGSNPQQVGLGVALGSIDVMQTRAAIEYTGAPLDLSIDGDGFFVVNDGNRNLYTRAGNFFLDSASNLVTSGGLLVQGQLADGSLENININQNYYNIAVTRNGDVIGINSTTGSKETIATIAVANFNNQNGLEKLGESLYSESQNSGTAVFNIPGANGAPFLNPSSLEMSNVDLAKEFTDMIITQRGFQANSRVITTSDQLLEELVNLKR